MTPLRVFDHTLRGQRPKRFHTLTAEHFVFVLLPSRDYESAEPSCTYKFAHFHVYHVACVVVFSCCLREHAHFVQQSRLQRKTLWASIFVVVKTHCRRSKDSESVC